MRARAVAALPFAALVGEAAVALPPLWATAELASDERRRGLGWSDGRVAPRAVVGLDGAGFYASAAATGLRGADRLLGADAGFDLTGGIVRDLGSVRLEAGAAAHLFAGAARTRDHVEAGGSAGGTIGPLTLTLSADYAPRQRGTRGDNLYVRLGSRLGVIGTPFTLHARVGRSQGVASGRATWLRPAGSYADWMLGVDHVAGPLTLGLSYTDTDIRHSARIPDAGARLIARVAFAL